MLEQFVAAMESSDAHAIASLFAQAVRTPFASSQAGGDTSSDPWRITGPASREVRVPHEYKTLNSLLIVAIRSNCADAFAWLFSAEAIAPLGQEPLTAVVTSACYHAMDANALALLEILLVSPVFTQLLPGAKQQKLLNGMLQCIMWRHADDTIRLLVAHGARMNAPPQSTLLAKVRKTYKISRIEALAHEGVFMVGARMFDGAFRHEPQVIKLLLAYGGPPVDAAACVHAVVKSRSLKYVQAWLELVCVDVDARDPEGQTPLIRAPWVQKVVNGSFVLDHERGAAITKLLLECGASVAAKDNGDYTPLSLAVCTSYPDMFLEDAGTFGSTVSDSCNPEALRLLLEHGADPNQPTQGDLVALDFLILEWMYNPGIVQQLEYLLQYGVNPFLVGQRGLSAVDRLQTSKEGKAFMASRPQWFGGV